RWILFRGRATHDDSGTPARIAGTTFDITSWKQSEEALRLADHRKDEFLATLAHELRNSLAAVRCAVSILRVSDEQLDRASASEVIYRKANQFSRLLDDLLDVSLIKAGMIRFKKELIDARATIALAIEAAQPLLSEKGHDLVVSINGDALPVNADP